jgi:hypothetical protein
MAYVRYADARDASCESTPSAAGRAFEMGRGSPARSTGAGTRFDRSWRERVRAWVSSCQAELSVA